MAIQLKIDLTLEEIAGIISINGQDSILELFQKISDGLGDLDFDDLVIAMFVHKAKINAKDNNFQWKLVDLLKNYPASSFKKI